MSSIPENTFTKAKTGYRFITKDPWIDFCLEKWRKSGLSTRRMAQLSELSPSTIASWDKGKTREPRNRSTTMFLRALGLEMVVMPLDRRRGEHGELTVPYVPRYVYTNENKGT